MPLFEYLCPDCEHRFEVLVQGRQRRPACPSCSGKRVEKQLSAFAVSTSSSGGNECPVAAEGLCGDAGGPCGGGMRPGACGMR